jgi:hypothetical protein
MATSAKRASRRHRRGCESRRNGWWMSRVWFCGHSSGNLPKQKLLKPPFSRQRCQIYDIENQFASVVTCKNAVSDPASLLHLASQKSLGRHPGWRPDAELGSFVAENNKPARSAAGALPKVVDDRVGHRVAASTPARYNGKLCSPAFGYSLKRLEDEGRWNR